MANTDASNTPSLRPTTIMDRLDHVENLCLRTLTMVLQLRREICVQGGCPRSNQERSEFVTISGGFGNTRTPQREVSITIDLDTGGAFGPTEPATETTDVDSPLRPGTEDPLPVPGKIEGTPTDSLPPPQNKEGIPSSSSNLNDSDPPPLVPEKRMTTPPGWTLPNTQPSDSHPSILPEIRAATETEVTTLELPPANITSPDLVPAHPFPQKCATTPPMNDPYPSSEPPLPAQGTTTSTTSSRTSVEPPHPPSAPSANNITIDPPSSETPIPTSTPDEDMADMEPPSLAVVTASTIPKAPQDPLVGSFPEPTPRDPTPPDAPPAQPPTLSNQNPLGPSSSNVNVFPPGSISEPAEQRTLALPAAQVPLPKRRPSKHGSPAPRVPPCPPASAYAPAPRIPLPKRRLIKQEEEDEREAAATLVRKFPKFAHAEGESGGGSGGRLTTRSMARRLQLQHQRQPQAEASLVGVQGRRTGLADKGTGKEPAKVAWPAKVKEEDLYEKFINCDRCTRCYHYGRVGQRHLSDAAAAEADFACPSCSVQLDLPGDRDDHMHRDA